ncbi:MAG: BTAD domain-containing putative transcriptional regulator [Egibacteraceae bacterium]
MSVVIHEMVDPTDLPAEDSREPVGRSELDAIRVLILAGTHLYGRALEQCLAGHETLRVVGIAEDLERALDCLSSVETDIILIDMGIENSAVAVGRLGGAAPNIRVVAFAVSADARDLVACAKARVAGYVSREENPEDLVVTIQSVARGEMRCAPQAASALLDRLAAVETERAPDPLDRLDTPAPLLAVHCLGPFRVHQDDHRLGAWPNRRAKSVFKYLVAHRTRPVPKEVLIELFWPNASASAGRNNLNVAVHGLRRFLRSDAADLSHVLFEEDCYILNPDLAVWVDVEEFKQRIASARSLQRTGDQASAMRHFQAAEALYLGALFENDPYEDWMAPLRRELQDTYVGCLEQLRDHHLALHDYSACATVCQKILAVESYREDVHRELMRCYARQNQRYLAMRQYYDCEKALQAELDTRPTDDTVDLHQRIRRHQPV